MALLKLALSPEGLGPFKLGQTLPEVLSYLRDDAEYRCVEVRQATCTQDVELGFPDHGFSLLFDCCSQRLRLVDVFDASRLRLQCGAAAVFGGAANPPTFGRVYQAFGPTYPTDRDPAGALQPLLYPGLLFLFPAPPPGDIAPAVPHIPLDSPAARICAFWGRATTAAVALAAPPPPLPPDSSYMGRVEAAAGDGLHFCVGGKAVRLGDSPQEVVSELGPPDSVYSMGLRAGVPADFFYNFFSRGVDVMFDGATVAAKKLVLHANAVPHPEFGVYTRCNFRLHVGTGWTMAGTDPAAAAAAAAASHLTAAAIDLDGISGGMEAAYHSQPAGGKMTLEPAEAIRERDTGEQESSPSRLAAAYNLLADMVDSVFAVDPDGEGPGAPAGQQPRRSGKPPRPPPAKREQSALRLQVDSAPRESTGAPPRPPSAAQRPAPHSRMQRSGPGGSASPSPGTSPSFKRSALGSVGSSSPDLAAKEERLETGSQYYDGWSDADAELSALVTRVEAGRVPSEGGVGDGGPEGSGSDGEDAGRADRASAAVQTADDWHAGEFALAALRRQGSNGASISPRSFVSVGEEPGFMDGTAEFENVPRMRSCSTQTPQRLLTMPPQQQQGEEARTAAAAAVNAAAAAAGRGAGAVITVHSNLADIAHAFGGLGKPAMHPRIGSGAAAVGGPTQLYGFPGVVFEVLADGSIATLTLFRPQDFAARGTLDTAAERFVKQEAPFASVT